MKRLYFGLLIVLFLASLMGGCGKSEQHGKDLTNMTITRIGDIFSKPDEYINKTVKVKGKITKVCPSGCWFYLKDVPAEIYIDLLPSNLTIPQRVGSKAVVQGKLIEKDGRLTIIGKGVAIK